MKTLFKKVLLVGALAIFGTTAYGQIDQNVGVSARILKPITITHADSVRFGTIGQDNGLSTIDPRNITNVNVGFNFQAGRVVIDATAEEPIRVDYNPIVFLKHADEVNNADDSIFFTPKISAAWGNHLLTAQAVRDTSNLLSADPMDYDAAEGGVTTQTNMNGEGGLAFISTSPTGGVGQADKVTLFVGGKLTEDALGTAQISTNTPVGNYRATMTFTIQYEN